MQRACSDPVRSGGRTNSQSDERYTCAAMACELTSRTSVHIATICAVVGMLDSPVPQGFRGGQARHSPGVFVPKRIPIGAGGEAANYHPAAISLEVMHVE